MTYFIYENWRAGPHKAVLHIDVCPFCNSGRGIGGGTDPRNGKWHGPFSRLAQASSAQRRLHVDARIEHACVRDEKS